MNTDDPWADLTVPTTPTNVSARRVDDIVKWDFYWARDKEGHCLLVLRHRVGSSLPAQLPRLKEVEVFEHRGTSAENASLILKLLDGSFRDLFHRLCLDIVSAAARATTETEAVAVMLRRTWRWHHLLRGGGNRLLSANEQRGLIGELRVLELYVLPALGAWNALTAWRGPLGGAKDFLGGQVAIESKARAIKEAAVAVSSEYQLDETDITALFLHVSIVDRAPSDSDDGFTITEAALRLRNLFLQIEDRSAARFDELLAAAGFWYDDDYSNERWVISGQSIYRVESTFPRLIPSGLPNGVSDVRYTLSLPLCLTHVVTQADLQNALTR